MVKVFNKFARKVKSYLKVIKSESVLMTFIKIKWMLEERLVVLSSGLFQSTYLIATSGNLVTYSQAKAIFKIFVFVFSNISDLPGPSLK